MAVATAIISVRIKEISIVYAPLRSRSFERLWVTAVLAFGSDTLDLRDGFNENVFILIIHLHISFYLLTLNALV